MLIGLKRACLVKLRARVKIISLTGGLKVFIRLKSVHIGPKGAQKGSLLLKRFINGLKTVHLAETGMKSRQLILSEPDLGLMQLLKGSQ